MRNKPINRFEGLYSIYDCGVIYSHKTKKILNPSKDKRGYLILSLYKDGKSYPKKIHRLVLQAFVPNPEDKPCCNHKDGDKNNNHVNNLEWVTYKENEIHARKTGLSGGEKHWLAKFKKEDIIEIRNSYPQNTLKELAQRYNVAIFTIWNIVNYQTWKYI